MKIAVFCSGNGSNFQAIIDACRKGLFKADIALMACDDSNAYAIERAKKTGIKTFVAERANFPSKEEFEKAIIEELEKSSIDLICLAGYMRLLSKEFVSKYKNRILNVHPALLPSFKGTDGIKDALGYGVKKTGVTVHFVNEDMDAGPIILQETVDIKEDDTEESLAERIHKVEHRLYPEAIRLFIEGKLKINGRRVKILAGLLIFLFICGFEARPMLGNDIITVMPTVQSPLIVDIEVLPPLLAAEKNLKAEFSKKYDERLELSYFPISGIVELEDIDTSKKQLLNPEVGTEKPLTKEEIEKMRIKNSIKAAEKVVEVMDSINAQSMKKGMENLIGTATKVINIRNHIRNKYHLHFKADQDEALVRYKKRF